VTVVNIVNVGRKQEFRVLSLAGQEIGRPPLHAIARVHVCLVLRRRACGNDNHDDL